MHKAKHDNEMLRGQLKKFGELTGQKIIELENGINQVQRMKDFENENYAMEKDKILNSAEFVVEQMKASFNERSQKIDEQLKKAFAEKEKLANDLRLLVDELKSFNASSDAKINSTMSVIIQQEEEKMQQDLRDIESKAKLEEEEAQRISRRNMEIIGRLQSLERESKQKLVNHRNEMLHLQDDLTLYEQNYNKLMLQLSAEQKDSERKKELLANLRSDLEELTEKADMIDKGYKEEIDNLNEQ